MPNQKKPPSGIDLNAILSKFRTVSTASSRCGECDRLELDLQVAVANIAFVVSTKFPDFGEKLRQLHKWQEMKDKANEALYTHKKSHVHEKAA